MEIKDERNAKNTYFGALVSGDVFEHEGDFYMKITTIDTSTEGVAYNAIDIADGQPAIFLCNEFVTPLVVQLHIIRND